MACALLCAGAVTLVGCDDGGGQIVKAAAEWKARQARIDPPQLWSVQVVGKRRPGRPVLICTDQTLRLGFTSVTPSVGGIFCAHEGPPNVAGPSSTFRCSIGDAHFMVSSTVTGDRERDFETGSTITRLDGLQVYARTLRFTRRGACPRGWEVGDVTDQRGYRRHDAVERP